MWHSPPFPVIIIAILCASVCQINGTSTHRQNPYTSKSFRTLRKIWQQIKPDRSSAIVDQLNTQRSERPTHPLLTGRSERPAHSLLTPTTPDTPGLTPGFFDMANRFGSPLSAETPQSELDFVQQFNEVMQGMDLSQEIKALVLIIERHYNPKTKTLDLSYDRLRSMPIVPVLCAIQRCKYFSVMERLKLNNNRLFGVITMDMDATLPPNIKYLDISGNDLYSVGQSLVTILPRELTECYAQNNHFGDNNFFPWYLLPAKIRILSLRQNEFEGRIQWSALPSQLKVLIVSKAVASKSMFGKPRHWVDATRHPLYRLYLVQDNGAEVIGDIAILVNNKLDGYVIPNVAANPLNPLRSPTTPMTETSKLSWNYRQ